MKIKSNKSKVYVLLTPDPKNKKHFIYATHKDTFYTDLEVAMAHREFIEEKRKTRVYIAEKTYTIVG